jgi:hypothetical protein
MLEDMTSATFSEELNTKFRVRQPESSVLELELVKVEELGESPMQERFSIIFRGPLDQAVGQGLYTFEHDRLGTFDMFIVPVARGEDGMRYEAAFNRMKKKA